MPAYFRTWVRDCSNLDHRAIEPLWFYSCDEDGIRIKNEAEVEVKSETATKGTLAITRNHVKFGFRMIGSRSLSEANALEPAPHRKIDAVSGCRPQTPPLAARAGDFPVQCGVVGDRWSGIGK